MYISASLLIAALAGIAHAETPAGFTPQVNTKLDVMFNSTMVNTGGEQLAKNGK
jgi:RecA/RadA recombinase